MSGQECVPRLEDFKTQELSNTFWGFASNDFYHEAFFHKALILAQGAESKREDKKTKRKECSCSRSTWPTSFGQPRGCSASTPPRGKLR